MNSRKLFALFLVLALTGSALALQQQRLYLEDGTNPKAKGVVGIQQHSVFVEIVVEDVEDREQIHQFAAVVGLVKKCKQVRNVFDNAVLWFNDQFLFGNKSNVTRNVTPPSAIGENPNRTISTEDLLDPNRNNGTGEYNPDTGGYEVRESGTGPNEGGNPDRDGFIRAQDFRERWGGCFIPNGFVHAIGSDDPYSTGNIVEADVNGNQANVCGESQVSVADSNLCIIDNIAVTKELIILDNDCGGCLFTYIGTFYITDPNNHRWMIDKFVYPLDMATLGFVEDDPTNCHFAQSGLTNPGHILGACGNANDQHRDRAEDDGIPENQFYDDGVCGPDRENGDARPDSCDDDPEEPKHHDHGNENFDNHCNDPSEGDECTGNGGDHSDFPGDEGAKLTTKEPMYTVHIQVDPWNPDRQGFPDEAIWAYRDGTLRAGMPYNETYDPAAPADSPGRFCKDSAEVYDQALEFDKFEWESDEGYVEKHTLDEQPFGDSEQWAEFRRGTSGNTVECAIEYNFLIAVDFEAFDQTPPIEVENGTIGLEDAPVTFNASSQSEGEGENEITRDYKEHGNGGADDGDAAWQGNSHPHSPKECQRVYHPNGPNQPKATEDHKWDEEGQAGNNPTIECEGPHANDSGPQHKHDALSLDLFWFDRAPFFVEQNPYWDHANETDSIKTTGTPPHVNGSGGEDGLGCTEALNLPATDYRAQAIEARTPIVCDVDAMDGFHLHDGTQTPRGTGGGS